VNGIFRRPFPDATEIATLMPSSKIHQAPWFLAWLFLKGLQDSAKIRPTHNHIPQAFNA
jgi:hypothetical protein